MNSSLPKCYPYSTHLLGNPTMVNLSPPHSCWCQRRKLAPFHSRSPPVLHSPVGPCPFPERTAKLRALPFFLPFHDPLSLFPGDSPPPLIVHLLPPSISRGSVRRLPFPTRSLPRTAREGSSQPGTLSTSSRQTSRTETCSCREDAPWTCRAWRQRTQRLSGEEEYDVLRTRLLLLSCR